MDQVDAESRVADSNSTSKKLARQLDFTPPVLPNHPQAKLQMKIEAKLKPKPPPTPQIQPQQTQLQPKPPPPPPQVQVVRPIVRSEVQVQTRVANPVVQKNLKHPVAARQISPAVHFESKEMQPNIKTEAKDTTPKKHKQCNCKNSRCLKLYCECFAAGVYCDGCNCSNCHNNIECEPARQEAVTAALDRNPNAFRPKIANSPHMPRYGKVETGDPVTAVKHNKGCHCKKSGCLKKYCECFQANIPCSENCRCVDCKNCEGSEERRLLCYENSPTPTGYYQPQAAASAVIKESLGPYGYRITQVSRKRKNPEQTVVHFHPVQQNAQFSQRFEYAAELNKPDNELKPSALSSTTNAAMLGSSKVTFRSLMADIIQPQFVKGMCSDLVVASAEVVKAHTDNIGTPHPHNQIGVADVDHKAATTTQQSDIIIRGGDDNTSVRTNNSTSNQADGEFTGDIGSTSSEFQNERPMSPGTLALMCDEKDTTFTLESEKGCQGNDKVSTLDSGVQVKQEKVVLTKFRDFLNHLIVCASVKESMHNNYKVQTQQMRALNGINDNTSNSNNSVVRPHFPTCNHTKGIVIRPHIPISNLIENNGITVRPQLPTSNHSASKGFTTSTSAANISSASQNSKQVSHPQQSDTSGVVNHEAK